MIEQTLEETLGDHEPKGFGTGWWSGVFAAFCGVLSFGAVLCLHFPQILTTPETRPHYPMHLIRLLIQGLILAAIGFGVVSGFLRRKKVLALSGMLLAVAATALGGASVPINGELTDAPALGFDWFLIDLFMMAMIFVPVERFWPQDPDQGTFRDEWTLDVAYFLSTHLPIQLLSLAILLPAAEASRFLANPGLQKVVGGLPWIAQFAMVVLVADLSEYAVHRALHSRFLWRFHAIHHSAKSLDWLAGSRAHFVDDILIRGLMLVPLVLLGFSQSVIAGYLIFVTLHATWAHANFRPSVDWLEPFLVMPRHHHWHHASEKEAIDKNYAIHFPWIDRLFGTYYSPKHWPSRYGLDGEQPPRNFWVQTAWPFLPAYLKSREP